VNVKKGHRNSIANNCGFISADFIFALVIAMGLSMVLFVMTFTFSVAEVSQYIVFSASRAHAGAHADQTQQEKMGKDKFAELMANKTIAPLFKADGWFVLNNLDIRGGGTSGKDYNSEYAGYKSSGGDYGRIPFVGVRADFEPKLLTVRVPFMGTTANPTGNGYKAKLTAFLIREPSQKECKGQVDVRYRAILELDQRYKGSGTVSALNGVTKYVSMEDNGC
jgi:hypothetical protein